jgi:hypothetical protein
MRSRAGHSRNSMRVSKRVRGSPRAPVLRRPPARRRARPTRTARGGGVSIHMASHTAWRNSWKSEAEMGQVDSAEAHLQKLISFLLERSQRICSRGSASSNLPHRKSRRAECEAAKPAGAEELLHERGV